MSVNPKIQSLLNKLAAVVNEVLGDSPEVACAMEGISDAGCKVNLTLEVQVPANLDKLDVAFVTETGRQVYPPKNPIDVNALRNLRDRKIEQAGKMSDDDLKFLKQLRIKIEDDNERT